jgi:hypothetical protein
LGHLCEGLKINRKDAVYPWRKGEALHFYILKVYSEWKGSCQISLCQLNCPFPRVKYMQWFTNRLFCKSLEVVCLKFRKETCFTNTIISDNLGNMAAQTLVCSKRKGNWLEMSFSLLLESFLRQALVTQSRLNLNSLQHPSAGITGLSHHSQLWQGCNHWPVP